MLTIGQTNELDSFLYIFFLKKIRFTNKIERKRLKLNERMKKNKKGEDPN